jgi:hypothetical protein
MPAKPYALISVVCLELAITAWQYPSGDELKPDQPGVLHYWEDVIGK